MIKKVENNYSSLKDRLKNSLRELNKKRLRRLVIFASIIISAYLLLIQADRFASTAKIIVNQTKLSESNISLSGVQSGSIDSAIIVEHIKSIEMMKYLDSELGLRKVYSRKAKVKDKYSLKTKIRRKLQNLDFISRLNEEASTDNLYDYFLDNISVKTDSNGIIYIEAKSFRAHDSKKILAKIIGSSERFINSLSKDIAKQQLDFIRNEVSESEEQIIDLQKDMQKIQTKFNVADPKAEINNIMQIIAELEKKKSDLEVEIESKREVLGEKSNTIKKLKREVKALMNQVKELKSKIIADDNSLTNDAANMLFQQRNLERKMEFATSAYNAALSVQEKVRSESIQNLKKLIVLTGPTYEGKASYPERFYNIALFLSILGIIYYILNAIYASIMSHKVIS